MREKVGKSRNTVFFQWFVAPEGRKSRLAQAAGAEPAGQMRDEKLHAVVARNTFPSQHVQKTPWSDHFWKLRCRKSARRCGTKHISKSKGTKHLSIGPLLEAEMSRSTFPSQNVQNTHQLRTTFGSWDVEKCTPLWREWHFEVDHFWKFRCRFASIHYTTGHYTPVHYITLHYTTLHSSTLHYTKLHYTTLHYTEWHCNTDRQVDR